MDAKRIILSVIKCCDADNHFSVIFSAGQIHNQARLSPLWEVFIEKNYAQSQHKPET